MIKGNVSGFMDAIKVYPWDLLVDNFLKVLPSILFMGNRKIGIELLRCFSLWGVILFHTMGFLDDHHLVDGSPIVLAIYKFSVYFVGIAVPLFMFISGYLYRRNYKDYLWWF